MGHSDVDDIRQTLASLTDTVAKLAQSVADLTGRPTSKERHSSTQHHHKTDLPRFDGNDVDGWLYKVGRYFRYHQVPDDQRISLATMNMEGEALQWLIWMDQEGTLLSWSDFVEDIRKRFGPSPYALPVGRLSKLTQTTTVKDYHSKFEAMATKIHGVSPQAMKEIYIAGLKPSIQRELQKAKPNDISEAFALASMCDEIIEPHNYSMEQYKYSSQQHRPLEVSATPAAPIMKPRLTPTELKERRAQNLCYNCDEKWSRGHRCKGRLFMLSTDGSTLAELIEPEGSDTDVEEIPRETMEISLHALEGFLNPRTIRLQGILSDHNVSILVDSGSTHNFMQSDVAKKLHLSISPIKEFYVTTGSGDKLLCNTMCRDVNINIQHETIKVNLFLLSLSGANIILGIQWLKTLGPVVTNYNNLSMEFSVDNRKVYWKGDTSFNDTPITIRELQHLAGHITNAYFCRFEVIDDEDKQILIEHPNISPDTHRLVAEYKDIFLEPTKLPPARSHDHFIHLDPKTRPINIRPYRYPQYKKTAMENMIQEMLKQGFIRTSTSPFSSPVVMVKKKDGSWRLCVDYRALNRITIKDKFPIPTIDELLGELHGASIFTKLDLRSGFHQIRVHDADIHKTAFRTHHSHFEFLVMPFGLTNAPSTFQALMNDIFQQHLRKFVLVFFDDILVFSRNLEEHGKHLENVFHILRQHKLHVKASKCTFEKNTIQFLGHVVDADGVRPDMEKIQAMLEWPIPSTIKQLRGFLGLTGYYRRFIKGYASIAAPMTDLLKKDSFVWTDSTTRSFQALQQAMTCAPILRHPDFSKMFTVETDACNQGVGAVLLQDNHPLAFYSNKLTGKLIQASTYVKEMLAITQAVAKWRHYLLGRQFIIKTDHQSLRNLLSQAIQTPEQQKFLYKLLGFDYIIEYKKGKENVVADALSRRNESEDTPLETGSILALSTWQTSLLQDITLERKLPDLKEAWEKLTADPKVIERGGFLYYKDRICLPHESKLIPVILHEYHNSRMGGHSGVERTMKRIRHTFWWSHMHDHVKQHVAACITCQQMKPSTSKQQGLLVPLPIPSAVWSDLSMDFVTNLPPRHGQSVILVVVDRLSKFCHLGALPANYTATKVAELFINIVVKLHGIPDSIVSDRDHVFTGKFWKELHKLNGTTLKMSSAFHPQTDGQTEVTNRSIEMYLRCMVHEAPTKWLDALPWAELWFNSTYNSAIGMSPFMALYGREAPTIPPFTKGNTTVIHLEDDLLRRQEILNMVKTSMRKTQQRMKAYADAHRREVHLQVGDWVWLKLQIYKQISVAHRLNHKLGKRFYGPFRITKKINEVAFQLAFPEGSRIHNVFHVSRLKKHIGQAPTITTSLPTVITENKVVPIPLAILAEREEENDGQKKKQLLVQWDGLDIDDTSWEDKSALAKLFPSVNLVDKVASEKGGDDTHKLAAQDISSKLPHDMEDDTYAHTCKEGVGNNNHASMEGNGNGNQTRSRRNQRPRKFADFVTDFH